MRSAGGLRISTTTLSMPATSPISEIFLRPRRRGVPAHRAPGASESDTKYSPWHADRACVGGGAFTIPENIALLQENGITLWIDTDFDIMRKRVQNSDHRPLARDPESFERLYHERRDSPTAQAEFHVPFMSMIPAPRLRTYLS